MDNRNTPAHPDMSTADRGGPSVWIGCLACYSAGLLTGHWIPAVEAERVTPEDLHGHPTGHEELWCFDVDGLPLAREMSPVEASAWGVLLDEVDEWHRDALMAWVRTGAYIAEGAGDLPSLSDFEERYAGEWNSFEDFAAELFEECGYSAEIPDHLRSYFDLRAWSRDLAFDYTVEPSSEGGVHVFRCL